MTVQEKVFIVRESEAKKFEGIVSLKDGADGFATIRPAKAKK